MVVVIGIMLCSLSDQVVVSFLSGRAKERWRGRGSVQSVVLVDDCSSLDSLTHNTVASGTQGTALLLLRDALCKVTMETVCGRENAVSV